MVGFPSHRDVFAFLLAAALFSCSPGGKAEAVKDNRPVSARPVAAPDKAKKKATPAPEPAVPRMVERAWPTFRGGVGRGGRASVKGPRTPSLKWVFRTQGRIYADAALAEDGTIYVASHDHHLYAVDPQGREKWSFDAGGKIWSSPAIAKDGTVYLGSDADRLISLDPSGHERWSFSTEQPPEDSVKPGDGRWDVDTSPVITADGTVIFGCHFYLYALRPSGILRWYFKAGVGKAKIFSSPALGPDGTVYFGTQGRFFFALNQSAKVLWHLETTGDNDSTPAVGDDGTVFFASDDGKVRAVAPGGTPKWEADLGHPVRAPLAIGHDGTVFASTYADKPFLAAIDGTTGKERWRYYIEPGEGSFYGIQSGALVDAEGFIYFGGRDRYIYCLSPTGKRIWRYKTGDQVDSGPVLGPDGTLYVGSDDKRLYAFAS